MSQRYLDSIRNPQPYPASDTDNAPSRSHTPVAGPRNYSTPNNPPSRSRTPASVLELTNPKPYPSAQAAYANTVLKPTAVKGGDNQAYYHDDDDKPKNKRLTKTRSTPRGTPPGSDAETRYAQPANGYKGGSMSSINLALQVADGHPIKKETAFDVEAGPNPAPRTTSIDGRPKAASSALGSKPINTTSSSHPMTTREKREKMARAGGKDEEDWYDDDDDEVWYKRHEKLLWILCLVFFLVVIFFAIGLGLGLRNRGSGYSAGIFANTAGEECRFSCRNRAQYTSRASNPLIVFAIDGLPGDLFNVEQDYARNIKRMSQCGVHSRNVVPSFASTTYPNLWTILTGRYPENHGVISDYIRSTVRSSRVFEPRVSQEYLDESQWYKAKPLWQTAREQGVITASHSWIGNNMQTYNNEVGQTINSKPNYYQRYSSSLSAQDMIDTVMRWIEQDDVDKIPQFISVFFNEPGDTIRQYGYNSQEANAALMEVDLAIGSLFDFLYDRQDLGCFNTMVLSPSALVNTTCGNGNSNVKFLDQELPNTRGFEMTPSYLNTFASIQVNDLDADDARDTNEELAAYLKCRFTAEGSVYTRDDLPARYHYSSDMIPDDVYVLMKDGKSFAMTPTNYEQQSCQYTSDGYDPSEVESKALFVGFGLSFRENYRASEFDTMDVYNLMTKLLGVTGEPNNGTDGALDHMLRSPGVFPTMSMEFALESTCTFANRDMAAYDTGCTCAPVNQNGPTAMERLEQVVMTASSSSAVRHIPFGAPSLLASVNPDSSSCKLYQSSYVMAYDKTLAISKYASFTLTPGFNTVTMPTNCLITDTRLAVGENPSCDTYGPLESISLAPDIQQSFLLQPGRVNIFFTFTIFVCSSYQPLIFFVKNKLGGNLLSEVDCVMF
eukprot:XP_011664561.1 PREDICTED: venom phosphodiesterase 2 [Strongylocentrotus purpuratus]